MKNKRKPAKPIKKWGVKLKFDVSDRPNFPEIEKVFKYNLGEDWHEKIDFRTKDCLKRINELDYYNDALRRSDKTSIDDLSDKQYKEQLCRAETIRDLLLKYRMPIKAVPCFEKRNEFDGWVIGRNLCETALDMCISIAAFLILLWWIAGI